MKVTINGVDRSAEYTPTELEGISLTLQADKGDPGIGRIPIPDPAGTQEPYAGYSLLLEVGSDTVFDGFVGGITRDRAGGIGDRLVAVHSAVDDNALLDGYVAIWSRPAETDYERMMAYNDDFLGHLSLDTTWVLNTHTADLPAKKYRTETLFSELQEDCGKPTGKTLFLERRRLHWHLYTEGIVAGIAIVEAEDEDHGAGLYAPLTTSPPSRAKDAMDLAVEVTAINSKGQTRSALDTTAQTRHDAAGLRHQRLVEEPDASTALLQSIANADLAEHKAERITYEAELGPFTAAQIDADAVPVGCLINVTDHVWGLSDSTQRVASETIRYVHPDHFFIAVQCGYPIRTRVRPPTTTRPLPLEPWVCVPTDFGVYTDIPSPTIACVVPGHGVAPVVCQSSNVTGEKMKLYAGATYRVRFEVYHSPDSHNLYAQLGSPSDTLAIDIEMGAVRAAGISFTPGSPPPETFAETTYTPGTTDDFRTNLGGTIVATGCDDYASSISCSITYISGPDPRFVDLPPCSNGTPSSGQDVDDSPSEGDGTTTSFTTDFPNAYKPGSLRLKVNGLDWTPYLVETDPTTGAYDTLYPIPLGADVLRSYKGA